MVQTTGQACLVNSSAQPPLQLGRAGSAPGPRERRQGKPHREGLFSPPLPFYSMCFGVEVNQGQLDQHN